MKKLSLLSFLLLTGCSPADNRTATTYFDLKGYLDQQIAWLEKNKPMVRKEVIVSEESDRLLTKDVDWKKELDLFLQADLNKPAFARSYMADTLSAATVSYRLREGEQLPVQFLEVIRDSTGIPRKIKASLLDKNYLFESERILTLETRAGRLSAYQIEGFQQLFFGEPKPFKISVLVQ
ncbi:hypothetical protein [Siphonobacter aquaeclarae]|uniref:Uncharacterized protein n=1 Tax=Siphonobacter aquaeclarae TaxID=563176 RepID=A0A1G9N6D6_9BACT|nr:hypothetical protein [Siphonobacter aquaeclarae]SDL82040.1 hypothetical protein SAMN04488090_1882 [Siphonobacter aquaeclarae]